MSEQILKEYIKAENIERDMSGDPLITYPIPLSDCRYLFTALFSDMNTNNEPNGSYADRERYLLMAWSALEEAYGEKVTYDKALGWEETLYHRQQSGCNQLLEDFHLTEKIMSVIVDTPDAMVSSNGVVKLGDNSILMEVVQTGSILSKTVIIRLSPDLLLTAKRLSDKVKSDSDIEFIGLRRNTNLDKNASPDNIEITGDLMCISSQDEVGGKMAASPINIDDVIDLQAKPFNRISLADVSVVSDYYDPAPSLKWEKTRAAIVKQKAVNVINADFKDPLNNDEQQGMSL